MSRNAIVSVAAINAAMSISTRDFTSVLLVSKSKDVKSPQNTPVAITSAGELTKLGFQTTDKEYILVRDYFGASTKPDYIWFFGDASSASFTEILDGLDTRWKKKWFYTVATITAESDVKEVSDFLKGSSNDYVALLQGATNWDSATNLKIATDNKVNNILYVATDKEEGQITNILATIRNFFPGTVPFSSILLNGLTGSGYSLTEILTLTGSERQSKTGVNIVTEEDQMVIPYYGKALDGITWFDYTVAKIAIDEYMRVGITEYIVGRNTRGEKISTKENGRKQLASKGTSILREFANRGIIQDVDDLLEDQETSAFIVNVIAVNNREAEIEYKCWFEGAIIKAKIQITLDAENGN